MQYQDAAIDALATGPGSRIIRAADAEAWESGINFYQQVRQQAERVEAAALASYDAERARGYADGKAEGEREAARLVIETVAAVDRYLAGLEQDVAGLAMNVVRRAMGEFDMADLVARAAAHAAPDFRRSKWLKLTVHPDAVERVSRAVKDVITDGGFCCSVEADNKLGPDACILASEVAIVDAGIETQLAAFADAFGNLRLEAQP
jgi:type III secretion protein L